MRAILISIKPKYVADILDGKKTLEIRKTMPKCDLPIDVYIYCTTDKKYGYMHNGKSIRPQSIVAKFTLNSVEPIKYHFGYYDMGEWTESYILEYSCLTSDELDNYFGASKEYNEKALSKVYGYAWHIDSLVTLDEPKELKEFLVHSHTVSGIGFRGEAKTFEVLKPLTRAPQSWCYIEV